MSNNSQLAYQAQRQMPAGQVVAGGVAPEGLTLACYWGLSAICLMNLNGLTAIVFGVSRLMSVAILVLGLLILSRSRCAIYDVLGRTGLLFMFFILIYLPLGCMGNWDFELVLSYLGTFFLVTISAVGAVTITRSYGVLYALLPLTLFCMLGALSVFLSPLLVPYYRQMRNAELVSDAGRWLGFFANPNETGMAGAMALACCLILSMLYPRSIFNRVLLLVAIATLGAGVFLTFSRGALIAFPVVGVVFILFVTKLNASSIRVYMVAVMFSLLTYWFFVDGYKGLGWSNEQILRIGSIERVLTGNLTEESDRGNRVEGISAGLDYWSLSPILGHGLGTFHKMPEQYFGGLGCHNTHLMVLGEVGLVGFQFYFFWLLSLGITATQIDYLPIRVFCFLMFCIFIMYGMVSHNVLNSRGMCWMLGTCFALLSQFRRPLIV